MLGPVDALQLSGRRGVREARTLEREGAARVLGLARGRRLMAVVGLVPEPGPVAGSIVAAARRAGLTVVLATTEEAAPAGRRRAGKTPPGRPDRRRRPADAGRPRLPGTVRQLQADGAVVLLVSRHRAALAAADIGVGVEGPGGVPAWGAPVLIGDDLEAAALLVDAVGSARRPGVRAVRLSQAAAAAGLLAGLSDRGGQASRRANQAVTGAAALALAEAAVAAHRLPHRVATPAAAPPWHAMPAAAVLDELGSGPRRSQRAGGPAPRA